MRPIRPLPVPSMTGPLDMDCGLLRRILDLTLPVIWRFPTVIVLGELFKLMLIGPLHRDQDHLFCLNCPIGQLSGFLLLPYRCQLLSFRKKLPKLKFLQKKILTYIYMIYQPNTDNQIKLRCIIHLQI